MRKSSLDVFKKTVTPESEKVEIYKNNENESNHFKSVVFNILEHGRAIEGDNG